MEKKINGTTWQLKQSKKTSKMETISKHALLICPFMLNKSSLSEHSDLEEGDESSHYLKSAQIWSYFWSVFGRFSHSVCQVK